MKRFLILTLLATLMAGISTAEANILRQIGRRLRNLSRPAPAEQPTTPSQAPVTPVPAPAPPAPTEIGTSAARTGADGRFERFGVDGDNAQSAPRLVDLPDGWSGVNGLEWEHIEPRPPVGGRHTYDWSRLDPTVRAIQSANRRIQANLNIVSTWAIERDPAAQVQTQARGERGKAYKRIKPEHLPHWANLIEALVGRYTLGHPEAMPGLRQSIEHIQIGSEPDNLWTDARGFIEALRVAYETAKRINPNVQIMVAGFNLGDYPELPPDRQQALLRNPLAQRKMEFLRVFFAEAAPYYDILSIHLNRGYQPIPATVGWFRQEMKRHGYEKPIWSEDTSSGPFLTAMTASQADRDLARQLERGDARARQTFETRQADLLVKKSVIAFATGVDKVFISAAEDWPRYHVPMWRVMGLHDAQGRRKPAYTSFDLMIRQLDGFTQLEKLDWGENVFAYTFVRPNGNVAVVWSETPQTLQIPVEARTATLSTVGGHRREVSTDALAIGPSPIYLPMP